MGSNSYNGVNCRVFTSITTRLMPTTFQEIPANARSRRCWTAPTRLPACAGWLKPTWRPWPTSCAEELLYTVGQTGGHFGAGLGVIELTIALHYVFDTPDDRLVWDVGHQAYPHKILTGRRQRVLSLRQKDGIAAFPRRSERVRHLWCRPLQHVDQCRIGHGHCRPPAERHASRSR